jgi:hypothetical protein
MVLQQSLSTISKSVHQNIINQLSKHSQYQQERPKHRKRERAGKREASWRRRRQCPVQRQRQSLHRFRALATRAGRFAPANPTRDDPSPPAAAAAPPVRSVSRWPYSIANRHETDQRKEAVLLLRRHLLCFVRSLLASREIRRAFRGRRRTRAPGSCHGITELAVLPRGCAWSTRRHTLAAQHSSSPGSLPRQSACGYANIDEPCAGGGRQGNVESWTISELDPEGSCPRPPLSLALVYSSSQIGRPAMGRRRPI